MHYEYRITSDGDGASDQKVESSSMYFSLPSMLMSAALCLEAGAGWAEVQFVQVDDDGTVEVLRRLRLD